MPAKNVVKQYIENGWYHIYNRGVEKRDIFLDDQDYKVFFHYLKRYLTKPPDSPNRIKSRFKTDLFENIQLAAYCLMPNHFHLMIKQIGQNTMISFMRALMNSYTRYFNEKCQRVGPLFQGAYKAILVETESYLLHLSRYIHQNPMELFFDEVRPPARSHLADYPYSSYGAYLGKWRAEWLHPEEILAYFKTAQKMNLKDTLSYQSFIEDYKEEAKEILGPLTLEE